MTASGRWRGGARRSPQISPRYPTNNTKNAGMVTGVLSKCCNYPCLVWKNTLQQGIKPNTTWTTSSCAFSPLKVYRGLPMACMNLGGTNAVQFVGTGFFQKLLAK